MLAHYYDVSETCIPSHILNAHWPSLGYLKIKPDLANSYQVIWFI